MAQTFTKQRGKAATGQPSAGNTGSPAPVKKYREKGNFPTRFLRWAGVILLCCVVAAVSFTVGGYFGLVKAAEGLEEVSVETSHPTYIYSTPVGEAEGSTRVVGTIHQGENRKEVALAEMPPVLLDALVAKEDERFREHGGVDVLGVVRALWADIRAGGAVEGASTITQQYVKNTYLSGDRSLERKLKETAIATEIERKYSKDEILGMYLNTVYFGNNSYGVGAAAETYFDKSARDLTAGESATLIGLLWSPSTLGMDREKATDQRNVVLEKMRDAGYITRQEHMEALDEALPEPWPKAATPEAGLNGPALTRDFAEVVRGELVDRYGANTVLAGGLSVYTTLDLKAQVAAQQTLYGPNGYLAGPYDPDAALVSIEPGTGRVTAMVGNKDEGSRFNLVTQARRQAGSSFKPFALIAALEQGIDPETWFVSEEKRYTVEDKDGNPEEWHVRNYEDEKHGQISLREALWLSDNSVFADLVTNAGGRGLKDGPAAIADVAKRLGVSADLEADPSIVLGTQEVSPMDMTTAYATIANGGRRVTPTTIDKVVKDEGQEGEEVLSPAPREDTGEQVIDPEVARKATEIMTGDITQGIAWKASLGDRPAAGKTGTTENFFDSWFVGFTPQLATGVWMGYAEGGRTLNGLLNIGGRQLGPLAPPTVIWQSYMRQALQDKPVEEFEGVRVPQAQPTGAPAASDPPASPGTTPTSGAPPESAPQGSLQNNMPPGGTGGPGAVTLPGGALP